MGVTCATATVSQHLKNRETAKFGSAEGPWNALFPCVLTQILTFTICTTNHDIRAPRVGQRNLKIT